jgi:glycosyltransferase involved in cell wall biosynthesis
MTEEELLENNSTLLDLDDDDDDDDLFIKPVKKKKILMLSDHQLAPSGVGVQARLLIDGLIATGKYTFRCLGGAIRHQNYNTIKVNDDFIIKPVDGFGTKEMIREILIAEKPDALLLFTDPRQFTWLWEMEDEIHQICPITYWHVWDNDPYPAYNTKWYESTDLINCLSHKTYELIEPHFPEKTNYIPHAFPKTLYRPLEDGQIAELKKNNFHDRGDWFKALWLNRNATRKMPADVLDMWKQFLDKLESKHGHRNALLVMHTDPNDQEGPNLLACAEAFGLQNQVWFSTDKLDFNHMNILHNITDTCINVAKNEGFGLSTLITMQVGKPVVALKTGGTTRQVVDYRDGSEHGVAIEPIKRVMVGSQLVPYIYEDIAGTEDVVNGLLKIYEMTTVDKVAMKEKVLNYVDHEFNYEDVIKKWDETLEKCINNYKTKLESNRGDWQLTTITMQKMELPKEKPSPVAPVKKTTTSDKQPKKTKRTNKKSKK